MPSGTFPPPDEAIAELESRELLLPVRGVEPTDLYDSFDDPRGGGRVHEAMDIMAERGTPVYAVEDGRIARLDPLQRGGGTTVYQLDPDERFVYYYAHLERFADGLEEGVRVERGQVIGYVGSTGNAAAHAPRLHFAIHRATEPDRWWEGEAINPFGLWR